MNEIEDVSVLFLARRNDCPDALAPAHSVGTASPLRDAAINHGMPNLPFRPVVRRFHIWIRQETKVAFGGLAFESLRQSLG